MVRKLVLASSAAALVAAPLAAENALGEAGRAAAPVDQAAELGDSNSIYFVLGIAAVAAAILFLSDDDDEPVSV
jgi:hypothetical protein